MSAGSTRRGGGRFEILGGLGAGASGLVYEALDHQTGEVVAAKRLRRLTPDALRRFKEEFRALRDLRHPNLVALGELAFEDDGWWLTMELVPGSGLLEWIRGPGAAPRLTADLDGRPPAVTPGG